MRKSFSTSINQKIKILLITQYNPSKTAGLKRKFEWVARTLRNIFRHILHTYHIIEYYIKGMNTQLVLTVLLLTASCKVIQSSVEPSRTSATGLSVKTCQVKDGLAQHLINNRQYFQQIRDTIPETGEHFLSTVAQYYAGNSTDSVKRLSPLQNTGLMKFIGVPAVGLLLLFLCTIAGLSKSPTSLSNPEKIANQMPPPASIPKKRQLCILLVTIAGIVLSGIVVTIYSLQGLKASPKISEAFELLDCTSQLFDKFYTSQNRSYSFSQFPDFLHKVQIAALRARLKNNRLIWFSNHFLQNPKILNQLLEKVNKIKENQNFTADSKQQEMISRLNSFTTAYQNMTRAITPNTFSYDYSGWVVHDRAMKAYERSRWLKISLLHLQRLIRRPLSLSNQLLSTQNKNQVIQWLKLAQIIFVAVVFAAFVGVYRIIHRQSELLRKALIYTTLITCLVAFSIAVILSIALPYVAWGCEGANHVLLSQQNLKDQIARSNLTAATNSTIMMFAPNSSQVILENVRQEQKDYFPILKQEIQKFFPYQSSVPTLFSDLKEFFTKYEDKLDNTKNIQLVAAGLTASSFEGLQLLYQRVVSLIELINVSDNNSNTNNSKIGNAFKSHVDSLCITNFNTSYETRNRMNIIAYAFLSLFVSLLWTKTIKAFRGNPFDSQQPQTECNSEMTIIPKPSFNNSQN